MLTLTASGSVSDYSDTSSLQQSVAAAAGVDASLVAIAVAAASVRITATIGVPASMTADAVRASLSSTLGTAADASAALGITVEEAPTVALVDDPSQPPKDMSATYAAVAASVTLILTPLTLTLALALALTRTRTRTQVRCRAVRALARGARCGWGALG